MKHNRDNVPKQNQTVPNHHSPRPQNKDEIDSRKNEEQDTKGTDITHNKKDVKSNSHRKQEDE